MLTVKDFSQVLVDVELLVQARFFFLNALEEIF